MPEMPLSKRQREVIFQRARGCCEYCLSQVEYSPDPFSIEHIIPQATGGSHELSNLALACQGCNNRKYTATQSADPITGDIAPLYHPRRDHWADHFAWSDDCLLLMGLTPTGRATIQKLALNRPGVVNLRRLLRLIEKHPPSTSDR